MPKQKTNAPVLLDDGIPPDQVLDLMGMHGGEAVSKSEIHIPGEILAGWRTMLDALSTTAGVWGGGVRRVNGPETRLACAVEPAEGHDRSGAATSLAGLYCEAVVEKNDKLMVCDARTCERWRNGPEAREGLIAYLGFPLRWPDGELFGTVFILDSKKNQFDADTENLVRGFRDMAETQLSLLYQHYIEGKNIRDILDDLTEGIIVHDQARRILFFNRAAEEITGFSKRDVVGRDCHEAFGGPFCGGRCSFKPESPHSLDHLYYPLNILTQKGEPRRIEMAVSGRRDAHDDLVGVIASFRDVSDLIGLKMQAGELNEFAGIVGGNPKMLEIYRQIRDLAANDYPVHITGETGTGKELVAAAVHNESRRGGGPFVPVNCAALPEGMLESELFGHVKGAFTGAVRDKKGRFELADGGTLFLDEVAELPLNVQAKLLRVLQEGTFDPVGGEKSVSVDVRLISATNRDLKQETDAGRFRKDLYYRINVVPIHLPPLHERGADIDLLLSYFFDEARTDGQASPGLSEEALSLMKRYRWPGNVRELQSAVRFAVVRSRGRIIRPAHLPLELREFGKRKGARGPAPKLDDESVRTALAETGGNKAKAARVLGVGRATLYRYLKSRENGGK